MSAYIPTIKERLLRCSLVACNTFTRCASLAGGPRQSRAVSRISRHLLHLRRQVQSNYNCCSTSAVVEDQPPEWAMSRPNTGLFPVGRRLLTLAAALAVASLAVGVDLAGQIGDVRADVSGVYAIRHPGRRVVRAAGANRVWAEDGTHKHLLEGTAVSRTFALKGHSIETRNGGLGAPVKSLWVLDDKTLTRLATDSTSTSVALPFAPSVDMLFVSDDERIAFLGKRDKGIFAVVDMAFRNWSVTPFEADDLVLGPGNHMAVATWHGLEPTKRFFNAGRPAKLFSVAHPNGRLRPFFFPQTFKETGHLWLITGRVGEGSYVGFIDPERQETPQWLAAALPSSSTELVEISDGYALYDHGNGKQWTLLDSTPRVLTDAVTALAGIDQIPHRSGLRNELTPFFEGWGGQASHLFYFDSRRQSITRVQENVARLSLSFARPAGDDPFWVKTAAGGYSVLSLAGQRLAEASRTDVEELFPIGCPVKPCEPRALVELESGGLQIVNLKGETGPVLLAGEPIENVVIDRSSGVGFVSLEKADDAAAYPGYHVISSNGGGRVLSYAPLLIPSDDDPIVVDDGSIAYVNAEEGLETYSIRPLPDVHRASLSFGSETLDFAGQDRVIEIDGERWARKVSIDIKAPWVEAAAHQGGGLLLGFTNSGGTPVGREEFQRLNAKSATHTLDFTLQPDADDVLGKTVDVHLVYRDDLGSEVRLVWKGVTFATQQAWYRRAGPATSAALLAGCLMLWSAVALASTVPAAGRYFFGVVLALEASITAGGLLPEWIAVQWTWLATGLGIFVVGLVAAGWVRPEVMRQLARSEPFRTLIVPALQWPEFRRRFYWFYVRSVYRRIADESTDSLEESYLPLPVGGASGSGDTHADEAIAQEVFAASRAVIALEAGGGSGKSALVRQIVRLGARNFAEGTRTRIPVIVPRLSDDVFKDIVARLGDDAVDEGVTRRQCQLGHFTLVIDGWTESDIDDSVLEQFLRSDLGSQVSVLVSFRTDARKQRAIVRESGRVLRLGALTEEDVEAFERHYLDDDSVSRQKQTIRVAAFEASNWSVNARRSPSRPILKAVRAKCRDSEGRYVPIFLRLAMTVDGQNIAEIYDRSVTRLLDGKVDNLPDTRAASERLCLETYWRSGNRQLGISAFPELTEAIRSLADAGILLPLEPDLPDRPARWFKFFHDSMQSFLTARALDSQGDWSVLLRAAGDPLFTTHNPDTALYSGELFQFCCETFGPPGRLSTYLSEQLLVYSRMHDGALAKDAVLGVLDETRRALIADREFAVGPAIETVVTSVTKVGDVERTAVVTRLFEQIAPVVYAKVTAESSQAKPERPS